MRWRGGELWQQLGLGINANLPRMVDALMCYMHRIKHDGPNVLGLIDRLVAAFHQLITNQYSKISLKIQYLKDIYGILLILPIS